jgi:type 1 glutamine amidotransferase
VLATAVSPEEGNPVFPVAWTNTMGNVRVFGTTLGHLDSWNDPQFQQLLAQGFAWALGR